MGILSDHLDAEQIPLGALGRFVPFWIPGWNEGRSNLLDELRVSYGPWDSKLLINLIHKHYCRSFDTPPICTLTVQVITISKWFIAYRDYLPPHQIIVPLINIPKEQGLSKSILQEGFLYTGPRIKVIEGYPIYEPYVYEKDIMDLYEELLAVKFSKALNTEGVFDCMMIEPEELYKLYMKGIITHGSTE